MLRLKALETQVKTGHSNELEYLLSRNSRLRSSSLIMGHHRSQGAIVKIPMFQQQAGTCFTILEQHWSWVTQERQRRRLIRKWEWWWWQGREETEERKVWQQVSFPVISKLLKSYFTFKPLQVRLSQPDQKEEGQEEIPQQRQEVKEQGLEEQKKREEK